MFKHTLVLLTASVGFAAASAPAVAQAAPPLAELLPTLHRQLIAAEDHGVSSLSGDASEQTLLGSAGVKFNPFANLLVSANVLFPLSQSGLTDNLTWVFGFDYSF